MSADVLPWPHVRRGDDPAAPQRAAPGDLILTCVNASLGLWCAWPVAVVDDDGWTLGVRLHHGQMVAVERLSSDPTRIVFRLADHGVAAFEAMAYRTWRDPGQAILHFAEIGRAR